MIKFEDIITENFSAYPEETQEMMREYTENLREELKSEIINDRAEKMLKDIDKSNETFIKVLTEILENGSKGLNKMSTRTLIDMFLEIKNQLEFMKLLEKVNEKI